MNYLSLSSVSSVEAWGMVPFTQAWSEAVPWPMRWAFDHSFMSVSSTGVVSRGFTAPFWHAKIDQNVNATRSPYAHRESHRRTNHAAPTCPQTQHRFSAAPCANEEGQ
jgi:hypothetical protein